MGLGAADKQLCEIVDRYKHKYQRDMYIKVPVIQQTVHKHEQQ
jgi:hypothetical protein